MPLTQPRDSTIAIVGDGFGSLIVYSTALYLGFRPEEITVFGPSPTPVGTYRGFAENLGQTVLRSESESHFLPADWPTFAELDGWSRKSVAPLFRSMRRRYNPGLPDIMAEAEVVAAHTGWDDNRMSTRVGWLQRAEGQMPHFVLYDEQSNFIGRAKHVMLAPGHGPLSFPPALAQARDDPALGDRIVQAYEPKTYAKDGTYIVVGAGIASLNEWVNAIDAGGKVVSLLRSPAPEEQDLNTPRCLFEALGIDAFQELSFDERIAFLGKILKGTSPHRRGWEEKVTRARVEGRFEELLGEIDAVEGGAEGLRVHVAGRDGPDPGWLDVTGVVCGTGFVRSVLAIPLMRRLVEFYGVPVKDGRMALMSNCGVPGLDQEHSRLAAMGLIANNVVPNGDTIAGLKYIGRRFVGDVAAVEGVRRGFRSRVRMQLDLAGASAAAIRGSRKMEQVA